MSIFYVLVFILLLVSFHLAVKNHTQIGEQNNRGYSNENEDVKMVIDRIDWANDYYRRCSLTPRFLFISILVSFGISIVLLNELPPPLYFIQSVFVCWMFLHVVYSYTRFHCDKFSNYAIHSNLNILRKKLGIRRESVKNLSEKVEKFENDSDAMNYA